MKPILLLLVVIVAFACTKNESPEILLDETPDSTAMIVFTGRFANGPYGMVSGNATILVQNRSYSLLLDSFLSTNGPDLKVYLSKEEQPVNYFNLGSLKSIKGTQVYKIPADINTDEFSYALIHCQQYNHLFGYAKLN